MNLQDAGVTVHRLADVFPMISEVEWETFVNDIRRSGIVQPIVWSVGGDVLVDGRNRLTAWLELGNTVESCPSRTLNEGEDEFAFIASVNIARRHMTAGQRAMAAAAAYDVYADAALMRQRTTQFGDDGAAKNCGTVDARDAAARDFGTNHAYVDLARKIAANEPDIAARVISGEIKMVAAKAEYDKRHPRPLNGQQGSREQEIQLQRDRARRDAGLHSGGREVGGSTNTALAIQEVLAVVTKRELDAADIAGVIRALAIEAGIGIKFDER